MPNDPNVHLRALQRAIAAGDVEAADLIRGELVRAYEDEAAVEGNPAAGQSTAENLRAGIGRGMMNVLRNVGNMAGVVDDSQLEDANARDAPLLDTTAGKVGNFVGETAATALPALGVGGAAARVGGVAARVAGNTIGRGVIEGATQGAILADPGDRAEGALLGGTVGALLPAAAKGYRAARSGVGATREARRLMNEGVDLSPGQMNPQGVMNKIEQAAEAVPVVGEMVKGVRDRASQQFQRTAIERGAAPGTIISQAKPDVMLDQAYQSFKPLYDQARGFPVNDAVLRNALGVPNVLTNGTQLPPVAALGKVFADATRTPGVRATAQTRSGVDSFLRQQLTAISKRKLTSDDLLDLRSALRTEARNARLSLDAQEHAAAELLGRAEGVLTKAITASISKPAARALQVGDQHYRVYKVLEDAVYRSADQPSGMTPAKLSASVRASTQKGAYARGGGGDLRELAAAGREVLEPTAPKTGLLGVGTLGTVGAGLMADPAIAGTALAGTAALIGTKVGRRAAAGQTRPQLLARELERSMRRAVPKPAREVGALYGRTAAVGASRD